ncbi:putative ABC transport system permease protein [Rhizobium sp. PP-F2F-G48]|uniref:ABC transporter permease n=1 Tax=Rhizobium sp. PP-F2F-G48 TaxID=2135651 RepID=UPI0010457CCC|nr:ABC transporter permease [Rhizobium sp. PP-F2F-G48]TCM58108.1 putative ABC transport system permease protein [Rhizobium sp. PP-F2F-G48]
MSFYSLAKRNALRKPLRAVLLIICIAIAFLIYGLTTSFLRGAQSASAASEDILGITSAGGRAQALPIHFLSRLADIPDVAAVGYVARLRGYAGVEKNRIAVSAADMPRLMQVNGKGLGLTPALLSAMDGARDRVLVGRALAEAQGWVVGQRVTITAFDVFPQAGGRDWRFEIAGIFDGETASTDTYFMIARFDYVNAVRARGRDMVDAFVVLPSPAVSPAVLAARIDARFSSSATPTQTQSEKQFLEAFLRQYADVGLIVNLVVGAAFVTLLMIVINTMIFAIRERTFEIGVLKTLGFSRGHIVALVLVETAFVVLLGGSVGLSLAWLAAQLAGAELGLVFSAAVLAKGVAIMVALSLATGALPAIAALRIPVINAFRTR